MCLVNFILRIFFLTSVLIKVRGDGCTNITTYGLEVINMCAQNIWTLGRAYISVTTLNMGENTQCVCVIRSETPGLDTTSSFLLAGVDSNLSRCEQSLIEINPFFQSTGSQVRNFSCISSPEAASYSGRTKDDVTITLTRLDTSVEVSYCLLAQLDGYSENNMTLTCQSGMTPPSSSTTTLPTTSTPTSTPSTTSSTTTTTSSTPPANTNPPNDSTFSTTSANPTPSTLGPTSDPSPTPSSMTSTSSSPLSTPASLTSTTESGEGSIDTVGSSATTDGYMATEMPDSQVAAIAGGVSGAVVLIIIIIIITVAVCKGRRSQQKALIEEQPKVENQGYFNPGLEDDLHNPHHSFADVLAMGTDRPDSMAPSAKDAASSSETRSLDGLLAASSSPHAMEDDPPQDNGAVSIDATAGSTMMRLDVDQTQPPTPGGDLYAVVNKPKHQDPPKSRPEKPPKPASLSTSSNGADVTAPAGGDVYAVVDKSRNKGGNAEKKSSLPSAEATPPPPPSPLADSSPSLVYADLEELKGEGRRSSPPRPPSKKVQETEYAAIDHIATANLAKEA